MFWLAPVCSWKRPCIPCLIICWRLLLLASWACRHAWPVCRAEICLYSSCGSQFFDFGAKNYGSWPRRRKLCAIHGRNTCQSVARWRNAWKGWTQCACATEWIHRCALFDAPTHNDSAYRMTRCAPACFACEACLYYTVSRFLLWCTSRLCLSGPVWTEKCRFCIWAEQTRFYGCHVHTRAPLWHFHTCQPRSLEET